MTVKDAIKERRSIRSFTYEEVPKQTIRYILEAGQKAPSAENRQPWYFIVLEKDSKDEVARLMKYSKEANDDIAIISTAKVIEEVPVLVLIFKEHDPEWETSDTLSIGACVENMILYAEELEIGSLWIRDTYCIGDKLSELYAKGKDLCCAVAFGFPAEKPKSRPRKDLDSIIDWYS